MSPTEPSLKRTVSFIDGQNLYHSVRESFGYTYPNYDVKSLSQLVCQRKGWDLIQTRFYTGVPDQSDGPFWNYFWTHKLAMLGRQGDEIVRISQSVISSDLKFSKSVHAFTQEGVAMLSSVLNSPRAIRVNIEIMRAFVRLRQILVSNAGLERRLNELEEKYDVQFKVVFDAIRRLMASTEKPPKKIGFHLREKRASYGSR